MAKKMDFLETVIQEGFLTEENEERVRAYALENGYSIYYALDKLGLLKTKVIVPLMKKYYKRDIVCGIDNSAIDRDLALKFDIKAIKEIKFIPYKLEKGVLTVLLVEPFRTHEIKDIIAQSGLAVENINFFILYEEAFIQWFDSIKIRFEMNRIDQTTEDVDIVEGLEDTHEIYNLENVEESQIASLVKNIFTKAYLLGASAIHIEPQREEIRVRFRVDGVLQLNSTHPLALGRLIVNRVKVMSKMNTNDTKRPQSGSLSLALGDKTFSLRISTLPTHLGEKITIRLLDTNDQVFDIESLQLNQETTHKLFNAIEQPNGIVLIVGATGSGKSTTLYAILNKLNTVEQNIVTIEDPVEYKIDGTTQVHVNNAQGLTFASTFREVLRQDPDIVMVGEIRDDETAEIANQAAMSGHLVFSTLHANNSCAAVARMHTMGIKPEDLANSLTAVMSQTLVRRLCPHCKEEYELDALSPFKKVIDSYEEHIAHIGNEKAESAIEVIKSRNKKLKLLNKPLLELPNKEELLKEFTEEYGIGSTKFYRAHKGGCKECNYIGYTGRVALIEFLEITPEIRTAIQNGATVQELQEIALKQGMVSLENEGIHKAVIGITSLEELHSNLHFDHVEI